MPAGHTLDTSVQTECGATTPTAISYTCGAGTTLLIVLISTRGSAGIGDYAGTAPTYNGVALAQCGVSQKAVTSPETNNICFYMLNPPTGSALSLSVTNTSTGLSAWAYVTVSFKANLGSSVFEQAIAATGTSTNPAIPGGVTTTHDGAVIVSLVGSGATTWTDLTAQSGTVLYNIDPGAAGYGAQYTLQSTAGNQAVSWTEASSEDWAITGGVWYDAPAVLTPGFPNTRIGSRLSPRAFAPGNPR